ncbi:MAG: hypothetical protein LBH19_02085, partial [Dysgonamonadaceae bacterium]|nr:hypothetical protein [Dysgonamonadaceae bacterium]
SELSPYEKHKIETNAKIDKLNSAEMNTINPFNDKRISITIPTIMIKEIANDSASSISDFEEYYYDDYFRISIERIFKSKIRSDIKNLPDLVIILQQPNNPSDKIIFESDTTNIKCLADENGYNALYYTYTKRNRGTSWGNVVYVEDKKYYYIITTWIGYGYETKLKYLIDKVITSFNIEK